MNIEELSIIAEIKGYLSCMNKPELQPHIVLLGRLVHETMEDISQSITETIISATAQEEEVKDKPFLVFTNSKLNKTKEVFNAHEALHFLMTQPHPLEWTANEKNSN